MLLIRQPERSFDAMGRMAPPILNEFLSQDFYLFETPTLYRRRILSMHVVGSGPTN
jgi:hypothetical protein